MVVTLADIHVMVESLSAVVKLHHCHHINEGNILGSCTSIYYTHANKVIIIRLQQVSYYGYKMS